MLDAYVDNELSGKDHRAVAMHLDECKDCAAKVGTTWNIKCSLWRFGSRRVGEPPIEELRVFVDSL